MSYYTKIQELFDSIESNFIDAKDTFTADPTDYNNLNDMYEHLEKINVSVNKTKVLVLKIQDVLCENNLKDI